MLEWLTWSRAFTRFLCRQDRRWPGLLQKIEELKGKLVAPEDETYWASSLNLGDITQFKDQLIEYFEAFTKDVARGIVEACGEHNALDAWKQLAERGCSLRPTHVNALMKKPFWLRDAVQAKTWSWRSRSGS